MARLRTIIVLCALVTIKGVKSETVLVETRYGTVRGIRTPLGGDVYVDSFLQIPYARPPTGNFRFHAPELPEVWNGVRDATEYGPQCVQQDSTDQSFDVTVFRESEDCLFLNVYTPRVPVERGRLPVMVAIHGGGFVTGAGNLLDGTVLAGFGVVVVAINYRLSALGFLSTEDAVSPGNYGILDQIKALEWVRDSISDFNGDPGNVTIFGESAGSASVSLLIASRAARGLFHRAIMESGVSVALWATGVHNFDPEPRAITLQLADRLGCAMRTDSTEVVSCLRTKNAKTIINATTDLQNEAGGHTLFRPVVETTFGQDGIFAAIPETIFKNGWFSDVPTIRGYNKNENAMGLEIIDPEGDGFTMDEFHQALKILSDNYFRQSRVAVDTARIEELLVNAYITQPNVTDPKLIRDAFAQLSTDYMFLASTLHEIQLAAMTSENPQYLYRFSYRSANRLNPEWQGVIHADELPYVFGYPLVNGVMWGGFVSNWTEEDRRVAQHVMTLWTNFAKYGNPTPDNYEGVTWFPWESDVHRGLEITSSLTPLADPTTPQITLWIETIFPLLRGESDVIIG